MENSKNFGAKSIKDKASPITKSSVQVSDSAVYYCLLRDMHSVKGIGGSCTKTSGAQVRYVVSLGTPSRGALFSHSPVGTLLEGKEKQNQLQLPLIPVYSLTEKDVWERKVIHQAE